MEFDKSRVYTSLNADEVNLGAVVVLADTLDTLMWKVERNDTTILDSIRPGSWPDRFLGCNETAYNLCYLVSESEEKKLKWTDLKIGDVIANNNISYMVTGIDCRGGMDGHKHIHANAVPIDDVWLENWEKTGQIFNE